MFKSTVMVVFMLVKNLKSKMKELAFISVFIYLFCRYFREKYCQK